MKALMIQISTILFLLSFGACANSQNNYWQCSAEDKNHYQWTMKGQYEKEAINKAYDACKKQSQNPRSCKSAIALCDYYSDGHNTSPIWQCTALDKAAQKWESNVYKKPQDAALAAKAFCQSKSPIPDSCYINLLTCRDLNGHS